MCVWLRPNGSRAATPSPTPTWTRAVCATTRACASAATRCPVGACTRGTLNRPPTATSATATITACSLSGRAKVGAIWCSSLYCCFSSVLFCFFPNPACYWSCWPVAISFSQSLLSLSELIHHFITEHQQGKRVPLCINPQSAAFKTFIRWGTPREGWTQLIYIQLKILFCHALSTSLFLCLSFSISQVYCVAFLQSLQEGGEMKGSIVHVQEQSWEIQFDKKEQDLLWSI